MKVVIIGTGNVATIFGRKILQAGHEIVQVIGRNAKKVGKLATELKCRGAIGFSEIDPGADIYLICVADQSIMQCAAHLNVKSSIVVHTAAAISKEVLAGASYNYGVLYPFQSLRKEM